MLNRLLDHYGKFLRLDIRYFVKASTYGSIAQITGILSGLVINYVFGHFASVKLFGDYSYILTVVGFLTIVTLPGLDSYLVRSVGQKFDSSLLRGFRYKMLFSLIGIPVLLLLGFYYIFHGNSFLGISFIIAALFFPVVEPMQLFNEFLTAKKLFKENSLFLSFSSLLTVILITLSIIYTNYLPIIVVSYFLGIIIPSVWGFLYSKSLIIKSKAYDKDLLSYGLFMTFVSFLPWTAGYLGQIILAYLLGTELLAVFVVAHKIPLYVHKNLSVFHKPITAKLANQTNREHLVTIKKHSLKLILWGLSIAICLYILVPFIIEFIFTNKYREAIPLAQLLTISIIPLPLTWLIEDVMVFQKIKKPQLYSTLLINTVKIILYLVLIPIFKLYGLVIVYLFDRYVTLAVDLFIVNKYSRFN